MDVLFKLLLAHLVCDFALQWSTLLSDKTQRKFKSPYLYLHGLIHFAVTACLLWDISWLLPAAIIALSHTVIDGLKVSLTTERNQRALFFLDQALHSAIIVGLWMWMTGQSFVLTSAIPHFWAHLTAIFFVTFPASIMIQILFKKWDLPKNAEDSLVGVGAYIGFIERILIYIAVVSYQWSLVGFLIAAKSVFRFGDFNKPDDRKYAEYLFVGTLFSLFIAILSGLAFLLLTGQPVTN